MGFHVPQWVFKHSSAVNHDGCDLSPNVSSFPLSSDRPQNDFFDLLDRSPNGFHEHDQEKSRRFFFVLVPSSCWVAFLTGRNEDDGDPTITSALLSARLTELSVVTGGEGLAGVATQISSLIGESKDRKGYKAGRFTYCASERAPGEVPLSGGGAQGHIADVSKASRFIPFSSDPIRSPYRPTPDRTRRRPSSRFLHREQTEDDDDPRARSGNIAPSSSNPPSGTRHIKSPMRFRSTLYSLKPSQASTRERDHCGSAKRAWDLPSR